MEEERNRTIEMLKNIQKEYGENNHLFVIPKLISKNLIGYSSMKFDFELINQFAKILSKNIDNYIGSSATYSIIALYGKCFTKSDNGYPKLEAKDIFKGKSDLLIEHNYLMDLRNKFIAHRTDHIDDLGVAYLCTNKENKQTELRYNLRKMSAIHPKKMERIQELFKYVDNILTGKRKKSGDRTLKALQSKFTNEELIQFKFDDLGK